MYHPSRGGVRGGRDQFSWDDVKVDKHRENYLGHSIKAPVGRWQKGKDLHWYNRDKKSSDLNSKAMKEEIQRIKEEEEQAMREALGLAPKSSKRPQGSRLDKHEFAELIKRGSTAEDLGAGHAEAAEVRGLGLSRGPHHPEELGLSSSILVPASIETTIPPPTSGRRDDEKESDDERERKRRKHEEKRREKHEENRCEKHEERRREKQEKRDKRHSRESDEKRKHKKHKEKRRHDSD